MDWNGAESQNLRFKVLAQIITEFPFSIIDFGCGYGEFCIYLRNSGFTDFTYTGIEISQKMIDVAERTLSGDNLDFKLLENIEPADFLVASGVFNVKLDFSEADWQAHVMETLALMNQNCTKGFAFNMLTAYSDEDRKEAKLYYPQPEDIFKYCKSHFAKNVALLHNYDLYEFTILVQK